MEPPIKDSERRQTGRRPVLTPEQVNDIRAEYRAGKSGYRLAKEYGVSSVTMSEVLFGRGIYGTPPYGGQSSGL